MIGILFIFLSDNLGFSIAELWLTRIGSADTSAYELKITTNITKFLVTGSICLIIGLITTLLAWYKLLSIEE